MTSRRYSVLVVDDDADARLVMRAALRKAGYDVRLASGGEEALQQFRLAASDLVMLDVDMPGLGGHEVCAALRKEAGPMLPIIMVTGMDDLKSVEAAYEFGATDFIAKPVNWALIGYRVRYLFRSHQAMLDLQSAETRNAAVLNAIPDLLFELDIDGRFVDYRARHADHSLPGAETFLGKTVAETLPPPAAAACMAALASALEHGASTGEQFEMPAASGGAMSGGGDGRSSQWFELSVARKAMAGGDKPHFIVLSRDITERKVAEARIASLAYFDSLTGLPNRRSFLDRVEREVQRAARQHNKLALLFMDLDGFKNINDSLGHAVGDLLLQCAAERLSDALRPTDLLSRPMVLDDEFDPAAGGIELARLGGDEFTALILDINSAQDALAVAERIGRLMRQPFVVEGRELTLTTSIGIALYPEDGGDGTTLLKHADTAMYHAKRTGRDKAQLYSASLTREILQRMELDTSLRAALERNEFHLVYQPQIESVSGRIRSVEALIRWTHPLRGLISPLDFIPLAEENGLIERIGDWVLRTACTQGARWLRAGIDLTIAVNLSPLQFRTPTLTQTIVDLLAQAGLAPQRLELEVTEGALMENTATTRAALRALREQGVRIALDDFGTGYSSLAYLTRMPIGHIKIDRCFVSSLLESSESEAIVRAVLAMARSLGLRVTAEGVETLAQAQALKAMGCEGLQGYYFSRPVTAAAIPALLNRHWTLEDAVMAEVLAATT